MKTTLVVEGRNIEFTDELPTKPGAYWWIERPDGASLTLRHIVMYSTGLGDWRGCGGPRRIGGLWSAPLGPCEEVEK